MLARSYVVINSTLAFRNSAATQVLNEDLGDRGRASVTDRLLDLGRRRMLSSLKGPRLNEDASREAFRKNWILDEPLGEFGQARART